MTARRLLELARDLRMTVRRGSSDGLVEWVCPRCGFGAGWDRIAARVEALPVPCPCDGRPTDAERAALDRLQAALKAGVRFEAGPKPRGGVRRREPAAPT